MTEEAHRPKGFKSSIWYIGLLVSGFCLFAGLMFNSLSVSWSVQSSNWHPPSRTNPSQQPRTSRTIVEILEQPLSEEAAAAQTCRCHPNKVPAQVEKLNGNVGMLPGEPLEQVEERPAW